jgi:hypothetical protein
MKTATEYREEANRHETERAESFERCDTDGFMSQWAHQVMAEQARMNATLVEQGGKSEFTGLFDLDGNRVRAKLIDGQYGMCWAFCDENDNFTGKFISAFPARTSTMAKKGYQELPESAPAIVKMCGSNLCNVSPHFIRSDKGYPESAK